MNELAAQLSRPADLLFPDRRVALSEERCIQPPIGCGQPVQSSDFPDDLSRREYEISALCPTCQESVFGG